MKLILAQTINGIALGSIYVLLVTGFNLMFLIAKIIHFSYPYIVVISMYLCWMLLEMTDHALLSISFCIMASVLFHLILEPLFRRLKTRKGLVDINASFILSMGIALILTEIMSHHLNYGFPISFPLNWLQSDLFFELYFIRISVGQIGVLVGSIFLVSVLFIFVYRTRIGRAFRAMAENISMARLQGIPVVRLDLLVYALSGLSGGIIALLFSILLGTASPLLGEYVALKMLAVAIVAGLGHLKGGLICGLILGIIESFSIQFFPGSWSNAIAFIIMLMVILVKPEGLFVSRTK